MLKGNLWPYLQHTSILLMTTSLSYSKRWQKLERNWNYENIIYITSASDSCRLCQFQLGLAPAGFILLWQQGVDWPKSPAISGWPKSPATEFPTRIPLYLYHPWLVNWFWTKGGKKIRRKATKSFTWGKDEEIFWRFLGLFLFTTSFLALTKDSSFI